MVVRRGYASDLAAVMELERGVDGAPHWSEAAWVEALRGGARETFVAEDRERVVGFAVLSCAAGPGLADLESVAVAAEQRRRGIGRALLLEGFAWARQQRAEVVQLEVRASSEAMGLYMAMGFEAQGRRRRYYRDPMEDAVLMALEL